MGIAEVRRRRRADAAVVHPHPLATALPPGSLCSWLPILTATHGPTPARTCAAPPLVPHGPPRPGLFPPLQALKFFDAMEASASACILDLEVVVEERCDRYSAMLYPANAARNRALVNAATGEMGAVAGVVVDGAEAGAQPSFWGGRAHGKRRHAGWRVSSCAHVSGWAKPYRAEHIPIVCPTHPCRRRAAGRRRLCRLALAGRPGAGARHLPAPVGHAAQPVGAHGGEGMAAWATGTAGGTRAGCVEEGGAWVEKAGQACAAFAACLWAPVRP